MNWFILTIISAVAYAAAEIIGKYVSDEKSEPVFIGIISAIVTTVFLFIWTFIESTTLPTTFLPYIGLLASSLFVSVGIITYYSGLKYSDVSEFALLSRSGSLIIIVGGFFLFGERFNLAQIIGMVMVLLAVSLLSWEGKRFHFGKGSKYALITAFLFALGALCDKAVISYFSTGIYTFLVYLCTVVCMMPFAVHQYSQQRHLPGKDSLKKLVFTGLFYGISAYGIYAAYNSDGSVGLISLISQLQIPIAVLWGILILRERKRLITKFSAMGIMILGVILLK